MREQLKRTVKRLGPAYIFLLFIKYLGFFRLYRKIKRDYGEDVQLLLCPHKGTGDICLIGEYLDTYLKRRSITKSLFLYRGNAEQRVGELFGINSGIIVSEAEAAALSRLMLFVGREHLDIHYFHHVPMTPQSEITALLEGYNGLDFDDMFRYYTFGLGNEPIQKKRPSFSVPQPELQEYFQSCGLKKNKSIIISPYASSVPTLPEGFWNELVDLLLDSGYTVATNCVGGKDPPLKNTIAISPPYSILGPVLEEAGCFIGWRSGLCDLISTCDCKKVFLYPHVANGSLWIDRPGKTYAYFNLAGSGDSRNIAEFEYTGENSAAYARIIFEAVAQKSDTVD
jgi:hypothetical protein